MTTLDHIFGRYTTAQIAEIAREAGTSLGYLRVCRYGQRRLSAEIAMRLEKASNSEILAREIRPDLPWPCYAPAHAPPVPTVVDLPR